MSTDPAERTHLLLQAFDPTRGITVLSPEASGPGYWVGAPGVTYDPERERFLLTYRRRRPRGQEPDRGYQAYIAESQDGIHFADLWSVKKEQFGSTSIERLCLRKDGSGYLLYVSYVDPADNRWRIDVLASTALDGFDPLLARPLLTAADTQTEGVKDPHVIRIGPAYYMFVSFAKARPFRPEEVTRAHATADIYATGLTTCPTGLAVSGDGQRFRWLGEVLPTGEGWDRYQARLTSVLYVPATQAGAAIFVGFYDGSATAGENYEERCGMAVSFDLSRWHRLTADNPWARAPHSTGSLRYMDVVTVGEELLLYYEYARPDGSHELRMNRVRWKMISPLHTVASI
jgi:hypothetical protein